MDIPEAVIQSNLLSDMRPAKRSRTTQTAEDCDDRSSSSPGNVVPRLRGASACEKCRSRKTKCDNQYPSCGFCTKRRIPCVYDEDVTSPPWSVTGSQILEAISKLSSMVERQSQRNPENCRCSAKNIIREDVRLQGTPNSNGGMHAPRSYESILNDDRDSIIEDSHMRSQGLETVLEWKALRYFRPTKHLFVNQGETLGMPSHSLPNIELGNLIRLEARYIEGVHVKNPILDLAELRQMIMHLSENGLDWSTSTCLVALVCAIGTITQRYTPPGASPISQDDNGYDIGLSKQFWSLAEKRLGFAMSQNDIRAVQCLCLAGIWHMNYMQPIQAWKYFNLAGTAWHALQMTGEVPEDSDRGSSFTVMQALYFTIWKSECELRLELPLRSSILDKIDFPHEFPLPPSIEDHVLHSESAGVERSWYYYLADIAARHLFNRLLCAHSWKIGSATSERDIEHMVTQSEMLEAQIHTWYLSLPPTLYFEIPGGYTTEPLDDEMTEILRQRYLGCRELVARPFVRFCIEEELTGVEPLLMRRITSLASRGLQYCMLKLGLMNAQRHQGTWFTLRITATYSLILCALDLAQRRSLCSGAHHLSLPEGWRSAITAAIDAVGVRWNDPSGGAFSIRSVVQAVLDDEQYG